jgi:hypothetical protein
MRGGRASRRGRPRTCIATKPGTGGAASFAASARCCKRSSACSLSVSKHTCIPARVSAAVDGTAGSDELRGYAVVGSVLLFRVAGAAAPRAAGRVPCHEGRRGGLNGRTHALTQLQARRSAPARPLRAHGRRERIAGRGSVVAQDGAHAISQLPSSLRPRRHRPLSVVIVRHARPSSSLSGQGCA